jgi:phospholipid transport system substrate-binding protein
MTLSRRGLLAMSLPLVLVAGGAQAQSAPAASGGAPGTISQFYVVLLQVMKQGRQTSFQQRYQTLAPAVDQAFDLEGILRVSVGAYWGSLPDAQRQNLIAVFRAFTVATYVSNFHSYKGRVLRVSPNTRAVGSQQVVSTTITKPNRDPLRIDYVMRNESTGWKVVDVLLDGTISRVAVQRSDFASLVTQGNASQLIATLKSKVHNLSKGAITV